MTKRIYVRGRRQIVWSGFSKVIRMLTAVCTGGKCINELTPLRMYPAPPFRKRGGTGGERREDLSFCVTRRMKKNFQGLLLCNLCICFGRGDNKEIKEGMGTGEKKHSHRRVVFHTVTIKSISGTRAWFQTC